MRPNRLRCGGVPLRWRSESRLPAARHADALRRRAGDGAARGRAGCGRRGRARAAAAGNAAGARRQPAGGSPGARRADDGPSGARPVFPRGRRRDPRDHGAGADRRAAFHGLQGRLPRGDGQPERRAVPGGQHGAWLAVPLESQGALVPGAERRGPAALRAGGRAERFLRALLAPARPRPAATGPDPHGRGRGRRRAARRSPRRAGWPAISRPPRARGGS